MWFQCKGTTHKQPVSSLDGQFPVCPYRRVRSTQCGNFEFSHIITAVSGLILRPKPLPQFYRPLRDYTCLRLYQLALFHQIITVQYLNKSHCHIPTTYCSRNEWKACSWCKWYVKFQFAPHSEHPVNIVKRNPLWLLWYTKHVSTLIRVNAGFLNVKWSDTSSSHCAAEGYPSSIVLFGG